MTEQDKAQSNIVSGGMRDAFRDEQIEAIRAAVRRAYAPRIRAAAKRDEQRALKAECNAEIARRTDTLLRERKQDGPHCL